MAGEIVGTLTHHCGAVGSVRKNKNRRLYLVCPDCGLLAYGGKGGQAYLLDNMTPAEQRPAEEPPLPKPAAAAAPAPAAKPAAPPPAPAAKKRSSWALPVDR